MAAVTAAITTLVIFALFTGLFFKFRQDLEESLKTHVEEISGTLGDLYHSQGRQALIDVINRRSGTMEEGEEDLFLLTDASGSRLAGNLKSLPKFAGWKFLKWKDLDLTDNWPGPRPTNAVIGKWSEFVEASLFVGDGNHQIRVAQQLLFQALCLGVIGSIISAAIGGAIFGLRTQRRFSAIQSALLNVANGHLRERIPIKSQHDDIDRVGSLVNAMLDRFETLVNQLRDVSTDIAHDLRGPISRLRNKVENMRNEPALESTVDVTLAEIDSIASTFDALLRIAEIESGARKRYFADVELSAVVHTVTDALEAVAEENDHRLEVQLPPMPLFINGDKQLLCQLLMNLIENSIKHCPRGSNILVQLKKSSDQAVISVKDDGPGIPPEKREKVFQRLYRLERSHATPGIGLGLNLVAAVAELHDGKVSLCDDAPGICVCVHMNLLKQEVALA